MPNFNEYLTGEVVEDYADGIISRREAIRQLGLLGVGAAVATPLLAACGTDPGSPSAPAVSSAPAGPVPLATEAISFAGPQGRTLQGAWAEASGTPRGTVLVIHEN